MIRDPDRRTLEMAVEDFFEAAERGDMCLLYFSGHGSFPVEQVEDAHLASVDTQENRMRSTGTSARFIRDVIARTESASKVVILDCCTSGALAAGILPKSGIVRQKITERHFGKGTWVLSASSAYENAYERPDASNSPDQNLSYFTESLLHGIRTGEADTDCDGRISVDELFKYASKRVTRATQSKVKRAQRPTLSQVACSGSLYLTSNPHCQPSRIPEHDTAGGSLVSEELVAEARTSIRVQGWTRIAAITVGTLGGLYWASQDSPLPRWWPLALIPPTLTGYWIWRIIKRNKDSYRNDL
ncbi:caspase domain-containing protein [Streptomyces sanglieri]|uniref:Caspase domain-containing protein n=1 Tax=Streptomyces sanglieri TaxID=193460 RepID=A0ABW2WRH2_9ACTN